jgi:O-antigen/teichoic acid export membrane protein
MNSQKQTLRAKTYQGAALVIITYGFSQLTRLAGNLILTRLLVPELFGVMALAQIFIIGLNLFSDFGIGPGIIQSKRGTDPVFLNTAWTIQILRGSTIWVLTLIVAYPLALFYQEPILSKVIPIIGFSSLISGFNATSIYTLNKELRFGKLTFMSLTSQVIGLLFTIGLAYQYHNIWALIFGGLIAETIKTIWSHFLDTTTRNQFLFNKTAARELFTFGKWIFISTAMMFLATQADKLILGKLTPLALFGVYNIAIIFAELPKQITERLCGQVMFPLISQYSHINRQELRQKILDKRKLLLIPLIATVALLASFGDLLIIALYDERYRMAAWMLPLLALGMYPFLLQATIDRALYAIGNPKFSALANFVKFVYMITCLPLSFKIGGQLGAILAIAANDIPSYLVTAYGLKQNQLSSTRQDIYATMSLLIIIFIFVTLRIYTGLGIPGIEAYSTQL